MNSFFQIREWLEHRMKKRNKTDFLIMILLGVLLMIITIPTGSLRKEKDVSENEQTQKEVQSEADYKASMEKQLGELISQMEGAGRTRVMITLADEGETYVDKDVSTDEKKREEKTVVYDTGDGEEPYVIRRARPKVEGVVVVSEGGENSKVATEISNAVMSLFDIEAHKVIVVKMSV